MKKTESQSTDVTIFEKILARASCEETFLVGVEIGEHPAEVMRERNGDVPRYVVRVGNLLVGQVLSLLDLIGCISGVTSNPGEVGAESELTVIPDFSEGSHAAESEEKAFFLDDPVEPEDSPKEDAAEPKGGFSEMADAAPCSDSPQENADDAVEPGEDRELSEDAVKSCSSVEELLQLLLEYDPSADDLVLWGYLKQLKGTATCLRRKRESTLREEIRKILIPGTKV